MTPYTSFLADDQASPRDLADRGRSRRFALQSAEALGEAGGRGGFGLRLSKKLYQEAARIPGADEAQIDRLSAASSRLGGGTASRPATAGAVAVPALDGTVRLSEAVMRAGRETVYRRGNLLIAANASDVDLEKNKAQIHEIERFSPAYFSLVAKNTKSENAVLALQKEGRGTDRPPAQPDLPHQVANTLESLALTSLPSHSITA